LNKNKYDFKLKKANEALVNSSKVQYVAKGFNFISKGYEYSGKLQVLKSIANYDYLWNTIRVKGGAYGVFIVFKRNGNMYISSYRDPNLKETLENYNMLYKYLEDFKATDREMTKYILGTISSLDSPLSNSMILDREASIFISGISLEKLQKERIEVINTKVEDIRAFAPLIKACMEADYICVVGNGEKAKENSELFGEIININM
jgi:Zn-dependent M16 (insulinase) family peptidase